MKNLKIARGCHLGCGGRRIRLADDDSPGGEPGRLPVRVVLGRREAKLPSPWPAQGSTQWMPYRQRHAFQWHDLRQLAPFR